MKQPLEDIKVLDLSRVYAAPAGSMILADLGADVIRVESPKGTDSMREWGPFHNGESTYYFSANRNKRSITLNLKKEEGKKIFLDLVKEADVVLENFKTGTLERLGLNYDRLRETNEKIILCSVTGFGQTGPLKEEPGFDPVIQALSGLMSVTGDEDGEPTKVGVPIADILTSKYVVIGILSALRMRDQNGLGQHIDLSLLDVQISSLANISSAYLNTDMISKRLGNSHNNVVPYQVFYCKDDPIMLCAGNNGLYQRLCEVLGHPEWASDPRFINNDERLNHRGELVSLIAEVMVTKNADEWLEVFSKAKIPAGKVNSIEQAFNHPQVKARETVEVINHPKKGEIRMTKNPLRFSKLNISTNYSPPLLGEHTSEVLLKELGMNRSKIDELKNNEVI